MTSCRAVSEGGPQKTESASGRIAERLVGARGRRRGGDACLALLGLRARRRPRRALRPRGDRRLVGRLHHPERAAVPTRRGGRRERRGARSLREAREATATMPPGASSRAFAARRSWRSLSSPSLGVLLARPLTDALRGRLSRPARRVRTHRRADPPRLPLHLLHGHGGPRDGRAQCQPPVRRRRLCPRTAQRRPHRRGLRRTVPRDRAIPVRRRLAVRRSRRRGAAGRRAVAGAPADRLREPPRLRPRRRRARGPPAHRAAHVRHRHLLRRPRPLAALPLRARHRARRATSPGRCASATFRRASS